MSRFSLSKMSFALLVGILLILFGQNLFAAPATLTWDAVTDSSLRGYKVYYGTASRNYPTSIDVKNVTSYQVTGFSDGTTYYFAVTAYSSIAESAFSAEVTYTTRPGTTTSAPPSCTFSLSSSGASFGSSGGAGNVTVNAPAGCAWSFSAPPSWLTLTSGTGNGSVMYSVAPNNDTSSRTANLTIAGRAFTVTQSGLTQYTITASAGMGGSSSPSGPVNVTQGRSQTFAIAANSAYTISDVKVDGVSQGAVSSYMFSKVTANHTITASFAVKTHKSKR